MAKKKLSPGKSISPLVVLGVAAVLVGGVGWYLLRRSSDGDAIRNVVLISIDTCRADRLSCYGFGKKTTPNIDAVASEGVLFESALTPVPLTTPAHSSMLTGTYPPTHGVRLNNGERLAESNVTLAEMLRDAGYQTGGFVGSFPLEARFALNQGFDTYDCRFTKLNDKSVLLGERTAEEVSRPAVAWLDKHASKPFFLFLHYYDAHHPYEPPPAYASVCPEDPYAAEIAYVDSWIGHVLERLRQLDAYENTLIIITGDHGESLGEHGEATHGVFVYQSTLRVPLVVRAPGMRRGQEVDGHASLVDIVPTVLDLLGLKPSARIQGRTLRSGLAGDPVSDKRPPIYCESLDAATFGCSPLNGLVEGHWKYIRAPRQELYDLAGDPGERINVLEKEPEVAGQLRNRLEAMLQQMEAEAAKPGPTPRDAEAVKQLATLGYVDGGETPGAIAFNPLLEDPKDFQPILERILHANGLFLSNRSAEAKQELLEIVRLRPQLITPLAILAQIALNEGRPDVAAERCATIVRLLTESKQAPPVLDHDAGDPVTGRLDTRDLAIAHANLAIMLSAAGKLVPAIENYEQALRIEPDYADAHFNLGVLLAQTGKLSNAIEHYEQSLRIKPDFFAAHLNLGVALLQTGKLPEAIGHYEQALRIDRNSADGHYNLGMALQQAGRPLEAIGHYEQVLRIRPDYARANPHLTDALAAARRDAGALRR